MIFYQDIYGKKKVANFFKTKLWHPSTLSTIPANDYCDRWQQYIPTIIIPNELEQSDLSIVNDLKNNDYKISDTPKINRTLKDSFIISPSQNESKMKLEKYQSESILKDIVEENNTLNKEKKKLN